MTIVSSHHSYYVDDDVIVQKINLCVSKEVFRDDTVHVKECKVDMNNKIIEKRQSLVINHCNHTSFKW